MLNLSNLTLSEIDRQAVEATLLKAPILGNNSLENLWGLVDKVWDEYECDNKDLDWHRIGQFYSDPVWLVNGLFVEQDTISMFHRQAISDWVTKKHFKNIVDFGGGFGTLARLIASQNKEANIDIYEPHPSEFGIQRAAEYSNVNILNTLGNNYDVLISTDVLEHVPDPLLDFSRMIASIHNGGFIVIANCFYPVIKCHLPRNFHFRYTFNLFAKLMGLKMYDVIKDANATVMTKTKTQKINWPLVRALECVSRVSFPFIELAVKIVRPCKRLFRK